MERILRGWITDHPQINDLNLQPYMYLAYSALNQQAETTNQHPYVPDTELQLRYQAYQNACSKYSSHIAEIRKYFPNWRPSPPAP
jgi:hypothetical protein